MYRNVWYSKNILRGRGGCRGSGHCPCGGGDGGGGLSYTFLFWQIVIPQSTL